MRPAPEGYTAVTPWIISSDTAQLLEFVKRAFGAEELVRVPNEDGSIGHAAHESTLAVTSRLAKLRRCSGMPDPSQLLIARVHGVAVRSAELTAAARELADSCGAQDGCLSFDVLVEPGARSELVLVSGWRSEKDMRAHFASNAYGRFVSAVTDLLTRPSDVTIYGISETVHPIPDLSTEPQRAT